MDKHEALLMVDGCSYGTLAMVDAQGKPYCVPLAVVRIDDAIYFHSGARGRKIDALHANPAVCLSCVSDLNLDAQVHGGSYKSLVVEGTASEVLDKDGKLTVVKALTAHFNPDHPMDDAQLARGLDKMHIWCITVESASREDR